MRTLKTGAVMMAILLAMTGLAPAARGGNFCDDINDVADGWAAIADALEVDAGEDVGDLDVKSLERDVNALLPGTDALGKALVDVGNRDEEDMGADLLDLIDDLHDVDGDDMAAYLVDVIDDLVGTLDDIVDYCDQVNE